MNRWRTVWSLMSDCLSWRWWSSVKPCLRRSERTIFNPTFSRTWKLSGLGNWYSLWRSVCVVIKVGVWLEKSKFMSALEGMVGCMNWFINTMYFFQSTLAYPALVPRCTGQRVDKRGWGLMATNLTLNFSYMDQSTSLRECCIREDWLYLSQN